ncbi:MAG: biliverdin-producing heme oxygenase [Pseudomonadota bacterium]
MTRTVSTSLRARLREDTRERHHALDQRVSSYDLTTPSGFMCFLTMQVTALRSIEPHAKDAASYNAIQDLRARAQADLHHFDQPRPMGRAIKAPSALAVDYMIGGSRLGTQVLKRRWQDARDPLVRKASAYFTAPSYIDLWQGFCATAERIPPYGAVADRIVNDVDDLFSFYVECSHAFAATERA